MTKKYTTIRIDQDINNLIEDRQKKLSDTATRLMGKPIRITKIKVIKLSLKNPISLMDHEVKRIVRRKTRI